MLKSISCAEDQDFRVPNLPCVLCNERESTEDRHPLMSHSYLCVCFTMCKSDLFRGKVSWFILIANFTGFRKSWKLVNYIHWLIFERMRGKGERSPKNLGFILWRGWHRNILFLWFLLPRCEMLCSGFPPHWKWWIHTCETMSHNKPHKCLLRYFCSVKKPTQSVFASIESSK